VPCNNWRRHRWGITEHGAIQRTGHTGVLKTNCLARSVILNSTFPYSGLAKTSFLCGLFSSKHTDILKQGYKVALLVLAVLLVDQASKFYIKTNFEMNEQVNILGLDWARLLFVENEGMAFGIKFNLAYGDFDYGKLLLSLFRILMVIGLIWYIRVLIRHKAPMGFAYCVGLVTAGALGNIIDSTFYALIFSGDYHGVAQLMPFGEGYGLTESLPMRGFLHGRVVDMFYFPITTIHLPEWLGGGSFLFFSPIFNVADAAITVGVVSILLFQRRFFRDGFVEEQNAAPITTAETSEGDGTSSDGTADEATTASLEGSEGHDDGISESTDIEQSAENRPEEQADKV
jgi:signal peptidase II